MNEIHHIQKHILASLLLSPACRYSDLCPMSTTSDHFNFHIKKVIELGYVSKTEDGLYVLTTVGKEYANRFDVDSETVRYETQAKIGVLVKAMRKNNVGEIEHLVQRRLKQPYYGFYGSLGGKVKYGESTLDAAKRELQEEAGLEAANLELFHIHHRTDVRDGQVLEDKFFFAYRATDFLGEFLPRFDSGENHWMTIQQIQSLPTDEVFHGYIEGLFRAESNTPGVHYDELVNEVEVY